jgi:hypothetical protein
MLFPEVSIVFFKVSTATPSAVSSIISPAPLAVPFTYFLTLILPALEHPVTAKATQPTKVAKSSRRLIAIPESRICSIRLKNNAETFSSRLMTS